MRLSVSGACMRASVCVSQGACGSKVVNEGHGVCVCESTFEIMRCEATLLIFSLSLSLSHTHTHTHSLSLLMKWELKGEETATINYEEY